MEKICNCCKISQPIENFSKNKSTKDGYNLKCKNCYKTYIKEYEEKNKDKRKLYHKKYEKENKEKIKNYKKSYYKKIDNSHSKKYFQNNKEKIFEYQRQYYQKNKHITKWRDLVHMCIRTFDKEKSSSTYNLLGYTYNELKEYLDKQGMNWDNDHIDHKVPLSWFETNTAPHIVNDLRNLQPLSIKENTRKSNKYNHPISKDYYDYILPHIKEKYKNILIYA